MQSSGKSEVTGANVLVAIFSEQESQAVYYVLPEVFRKEICAGFDARAVAALLAKHGYLDTDPKDSRLAKKVRLPLIGATRCYVVKPSIFELEG